MNSLTDLLEKLKVLDKEATAGPWEERSTFRESRSYVNVGVKDSLRLFTYEFATGHSPEQSKAQRDAQLIAEARNNIRKLISVIEIYREALRHIGDPGGIIGGCCNELTYNDGLDVHYEKVAEKALAKAERAIDGKC